MNPNILSFLFLFCKHGCATSSRLKRVGIVQLFSSKHSVHNYLSLMVWGCISGNISLHIPEVQHNFMFFYVLLKIL